MLNRPPAGLKVWVVADRGKVLISVLVCDWKGVNEPVEREGGKGRTPPRPPTWWCGDSTVVKYGTGWRV